MRVFDWDADLPEEKRDALIESLAQKVSRHRMGMPAILFLEMHKPLSFLASQTMVLGSGFLAPVFGPQNVQQYSKLFESRDNVERLIRRIEEMLADGARPLTPSPAIDTLAIDTEDRITPA